MRTLVLMALVLVGVTASVSLGGCSSGKCVKWEDRVVYYTVCERYSDTGWCAYSTTSSRLQKVCTKLENEDGTTSASGKSSEPRIAQVITAKNFDNFELDRAGCYGNPSLSCLIKAVRGLVVLEKTPISQSSILAEVAVVHAAAGDENGAFGSLAEMDSLLSKIRKVTKPKYKYVSNIESLYAIGAFEIAMEFARNGNDVAVRKALQLLTDATDSTNFSSVKASNLFKITYVKYVLGDRDAVENLSEMVEKKALGRAYKDYRINYLSPLLVFYVDQGNNAEARRLFALINGFAKEMKSNPPLEPWKQHSAYTALAKAQIAMRAIPAATRTVGKLPGVRDLLESDYLRTDIKKDIAELLDEIRVARGSPGSASPETITDRDKRVVAWIALARANIARGNAMEARRAVTNALTTIEKFDDLNAMRAERLSDVAKLLATPEGRAAERIWTTQPTSRIMPEDRHENANLASRILPY